MSIQPVVPHPLASAAARDWWLIALRGVCILAIGLFALARPSEFFFAIVAFAVLAIVAGILTIAHAVRLPPHAAARAFLVLEGIAGIAIGIFVFEYVHRTMFLAYTIALWTIVIGAIMLAFAIVLRSVIPLAWLWGLLGVAFVAIGIAIIATPGAFALGPAFIVGLVGSAVGIGLIVLGLALRTKQG